MKNKQYNFTKAFICSLNPAEKGKRYMVYDNKCSSLAVRITDKGNKSFVIQTRFEGRVIKITLGKYPNLSIEQARKKYIKILNEIENGINPNDILKNKRQEYTFGKLFKEYMERYSKIYKKSWKYDEREIPRFSRCWFKRKISNISTQEIRKLHDSIRVENGLYQANRMYERIRAMYNKAIEWGYIKENPAVGVKKFKEKKRERFLLPAEIKSFFKSLELEENKVVKDYFKILLFTGARKTNVLAMRWDEIDFDRRIWRIPETKNGESLEVPLIDYAIEVLNNIDKTNEWVFPSKTSKKGHFSDPKRPWKRILERAGIKDLRIHDIRRTLGSYQAITGSSLSIIGRSLGHKSLEATQIYARLNNDTVRKSMGKAIDKMYEYKG